MNREKIANALEARFKKRVSDSAGMSFEDSKVSLPHRSIWLDYADAAIQAIEAKP